jgi:hypothetical protein
MIIARRLVLWQKQAEMISNIKEDQAAILNELGA